MFTRTTIMTGLMFLALTGTALAEATATTTTTTTTTPVAVKTAPAKKMFGDADGDGRVSKSEFLANYERRFDRSDANKDGFITQEERDAEAAAKAKATAKKASATMNGDVTVDGEKPSFLRRLFN